MAWIKRNLYFVIFAVVGLGVTGYCGYLLYSAVGNNRGVREEYTAAVGGLAALQQKPPFPSKENIQAAKADQERVKAFLAEFRKAFASFPVPPKEDERGFKDYLQGTIYQWGKEATNAGVLLPDNYAFSFSQIKDKLTYPPEAIAPWMQQLEELRVILHILFKSKILYLEGVQRCPITLEDYGGNDCIYTTPVTNQATINTPYKVMFRGFSTEIAAVLSGFASATNCFIVKDIDVSQSKAPLPAPPVPVAQPLPQNNMRQRNPDFYNRGGGRGRGGDYGEDYYQRRMMPQQAAPVPEEPAGPVLILSENPLFVTISVDLVKLKSVEPVQPKPVHPKSVEPVQPK